MSSALPKTLSLYEWRQFARVELELHPRLTIITGTNGSGKTTILRTLGSLTGWAFEFIGSTAKEQKRIRNALLTHSEKYLSITLKPSARSTTVGEISYDDNGASLLVLPDQARASYALKYSPARLIPGIFIPSHRPLPIYEPVKEIPTRLEASTQLFARYVDSYRQVFAPNSRVKGTPTFRLKSSLISLATFGYGNQVVERDNDAVATFEGFEQILREVLPPALGFERLTIRMPDIEFITKTGDFSIDAISGGISVILDLAWQLFLCSLIYEEFLVIIDEPENHLHPALQRTLFPRFIEAFPTARFIAATHNPFIVSSLPDSRVYALQYNDNNKIESKLLDLEDLSGSSNEILREVLGVPVTVPGWVESRLNEITNEYLNKPITTEVLAQIKAQMEELGAAELFPDALERIMGAKK